MKSVLSIILMVMWAGVPVLGGATPTSGPAVRKKVVRQMLVIGNSLTRHPPLGNSDWKNDWGMAATSMGKDYSHLLYKHLCQYQPAPKPELLVTRLYDPDLTVEKARKEVTAQKADLILVQLGDNLRFDKSNVEKLSKGYEQLLQELQSTNPKALIFGVSTWGGNVFTNNVMEKACRNRKVTFINISDLIRNPKNSAGSEGHFKHAGVAWHPGDRGMKAIADRVWKTIRSELVSKPNKDK